jgi:hypothetical protein
MRQGEFDRWNFVVFLSMISQTPVVPSYQCVNRSFYVRRNTNA